jgi:hypothetical protein
MAELEDGSDSAAAADLTVKGAACVFRALADGWVRGVGCDDEGLDDDDDGDKSPNCGAGLAAIMTAGVRRQRAAALAAIAHLSSGV